MKFNIEIELSQDEFNSLKKLCEIIEKVNYKFNISSKEFVSNWDNRGSILNNLKNKELIQIYDSPTKFSYESTLCAGMDTSDLFYRPLHNGYELIKQNEK